MKKFISLAFLISILLALACVAAGVTLASSHPFRPGDFFFPVQSFTEQSRANLLSSQTGKAIYYLELVQQRNTDLAALSGSEAGWLALEYLNQALDQAAGAVAAVPQQDAGQLSARLADLALQVEANLAALEPASGEQAAAYIAMQAKVRVLLNMLTGGGGLDQIGQVVSEQPTGQRLRQPVAISQVEAPGVTPRPEQVSPRPVLFPPGSPGALHTFFPLTGKHALLDCAACHQDGRYAGSPGWCEACHAGDKPAGHFPGDCAACHNPAAWTEVDFNHLLARAADCQVCHIQDRPANHYSGQCSLCHNTSSWGEATFNHQAVGATDCQACHSQDRPANHFEGQCSQCHSTSTWQGATFNHSFPTNHGKANGECAQCHPSGTQSWTCSNCHEPGKMDNKHKEIPNYSGRCLDCHPDGKEPDDD